MLGIYCRTSKERDIETSTINQQRLAGIKFAEEHSFEYELYEDEGKSGYKISDDDQDPFNLWGSNSPPLGAVKKERKI